MPSSFYELQPEACRAPLAPKKLRLRGRRAPVIERVLAYDPAPAYARIAETAAPLRRIQVRTNLSLERLFPAKRDGTCDCGCGQTLQGRQRRWAAPACAEFVWYVYAIIAGRRTEIKQCLHAYFGRACSLCRAVPVKARGLRTRSALEWDHIIPVHRGGGACWLGNYRPLCPACHGEKTATEREARVRAGKGSL